MGRSTLPTAPRSILLVRLSSLGDVVCGMPLATALRRRFPRARLHWAVEPDAEPLLLHHSSGAQPVPVPRRGGLGTRSRTVGALRAVRPDLVVDAQGNTKSGTVARLAARGAPILGFAREDVREWSNLAFSTVKAPPSGERHTVRRNLALLRPLGLDPAEVPLDYGLGASAEEVAAGRRRLREAGVAPGRPVVVLHPGRLRDIRTWTAEGIVSLAGALLDRGRTVVLEGPDPERPAAAREALAALRDRGAADLTGDVPLRELVGILVHLARERAAGGPPHVLVSPDTLVPHLAAATGLPVVLLAGPQDPARTGPLAEATRVVKAWEGLPCAPCLRRRCHFEEDRACMRRISVAAVLEAVETLSHP